MGAKLLLIMALALVMMLPVLFVGGLVTERSDRASQVERDISALVGGPQTVLGPTLLIPYQAGSSRGLYAIFPVRGTATVVTTTEERHRSLFRVPVYRASVTFHGEFDLSNETMALPNGAELDWSRAEIVEGISDLRGITSDVTVSINSQSTTLIPSQLLTTLGEKGTRVLNMVGARMPGVLNGGARFHFTSTLPLSGAEQLSLLAYGKTTSVNAMGDWHNPGFEGAFLPIRRDITKRGFDAQWTVPFVARRVPEAGPLSNIAGIHDTALTTSFIELADPYQSVNRALKYAFLFVSVVFLSYFLFEVTAGRRIHLAQYALVGIAQVIFYLLLVSFAERAGFDWSFLLGGGATVCLLSLNSAWVFESRTQGFRAFGVFSLLYGLIYLLLRLEDNALMVGALASFMIVAAVMYLTRNIDWHKSRLFSREAKDGDLVADPGIAKL